MNATAPPRPPVRALGLCSGGLDSMLAAQVLRDQGVEVEWVSFETPFFGASKARQAARRIGIPLAVRDITEVYLDMLRNPRCGYGRHMNPCMDCHALMFRLAGEMMAEGRFDFLFSGEVLGQRPMSQTANSLRYVEKHSGHAGFILRPLSARRLPETVPEQRAWVDRARLLDISGRGRKRQMALAEHYGIRDYPAPAGGCLLTDKGYSARLGDLFAHRSNVTRAELELLRHGRHLRLDDAVKIVVGRTRSENEQIERCIDPRRDARLRMDSFPGPLVAVPGGARDELLTLAGAICAGYSKAPPDAPVDVRIDTPAGTAVRRVLPLPPAEARRFLIK